MLWLDRASYSKIKCSHKKRTKNTKNEWKIRTKRTKNAKNARKIRKKSAIDEQKLIQSKMNQRTSFAGTNIWHKWSKCGNFMMYQKTNGDIYFRIKLLLRCIGVSFSLPLLRADQSIHLKWVFDWTSLLMAEVWNGQTINITIRPNPIWINNDRSFNAANRAPVETRSNTTTSFCKCNRCSRKCCTLERSAMADPFECDKNDECMH